MGMGNIATSGMQAAMSDMETISNNIANAKSTGFKSSSASFADIVPSGNDASGPQIGLGAKLTSVQQQFTPGTLTTTNFAGDLTVSGSGFFILHDSVSGQTSYTRTGHFDFDSTSGYFTLGNQRLQGFPAINGTVPSGSVPSDIQLKTGAQPASASTVVTAQGLNLNSSDALPTTSPFNENDATSYNYTTHATVYDSLGNKNNFDVYYVKTAANQWSAYAAINGNVLNSTSPGSLSFDQDGKLTAATGLNALSYTPTNGAAPLTLDLIMSGTTQFGNSDSTLPFTTDGYPAGSFASYTIDLNGMLTANYTNGPAVLVGQVATALFQSPESLQNQGGGQWIATSSSGLPSVNPVNSVNSVQQGVLEGSNVDLASELVSLISAQNTFQANAQVEQVYNQVMQTVIKL